MCDTVYSRTERARSPHLADWNLGVRQAERAVVMGRDSEVLRAPRGSIKTPESPKKKKKKDDLSS